jgi:hypothetical protein
MFDSHTALIFAPSQIATARAVARAIGVNPLLSNGACRVCADVASVHETLRQLPHRRCIIILLAGCQAELDQMLGLAEWFEDFPLILMQPDEQRDTTAKAHRLRPRYLMGPTIDFPELRAVVAKLLFRQQPRRPLGLNRRASVLISLKSRAHGYFRIRRTPLPRRRKGINAWDPIATLCKERKSHV